MDGSKHFKAVGQAYLAAIEGALGARLDAKYPGKTYKTADLAATLHRFYREWSPKVDGLSSGTSVLASEGALKELGPLHSAKEIKPPLRDACSKSSGIYFMGRLGEQDRIRSLLMFADAILFWDPFEETLRKNRLDPETVSFALDELRELRPLIEAGLVVPAQLARVRVDDDAERETIQADFATTLMWQGAMGRRDYNNSVQNFPDGTFILKVPADQVQAKGYRGYAENKIAVNFLPDLAVPVINYSSLANYQKFCKSLDEQLQAREILFTHQSLAFETGFLINPENLTNKKILELRERDVIFRKFREVVVQAIQSYEDELATGHGAKFIKTFNAEVQNAFTTLKNDAKVSNTWKEFVDERVSLSTRIIAKVAEVPLTGKIILDELREVIADAGATATGNLLAAAFKTYSRYRNTKVLLDFVAAVREVHEDDAPIAI